MAKDARYVPVACEVIAYIPGPWFIDEDIARTRYPVDRPQSGIDLDSNLMVSNSHFGICERNQRGQGST